MGEKFSCKKIMSSIKSGKKKLNMAQRRQDGGQEKL
jgi:hypothetical protein